MDDSRFSRRTFMAVGAAAALPPDERMQTAYAAASKVLRLDKKDLDHGLELHASSVVFDAYGFAPGAALDGDAFRAALEAGASEAELKDLQEEMSMTRCVTSSAERQEFMRAWQASGVTCIFQNAGEEGQDGLRMLKRLARFTYVTDMLSNFVVRAVRPQDVIAAKKQGKRALYFSSNGIPLAQAWNSVEEELRYVRIFFQLGIRMMHVTYNRRNMIGDGCGEAANGGLSDFGRAAIAELNRVGVIVDVAHSGWRTSLEAAKASRCPMVASHSGCAAIRNHYRCKPDDVIRAIADTGGYIGICAIPEFLGGGIEALLAHVDYVVKKFGVDHVAIGTDVTYRSRNAAAESAKIPKRGKTREEFRSLWPPAELSPTGGGGGTLAWTNWPLFTVGLVQRGYSDSDIQKIIGGNALRVAGAALTSPG
jgi:membrane dipeptidase